MPTERRERWFDGLQVLRALLFAIVFVSHSGEFAAVDGAWGGAAVAVFFVLSGFLCGCRQPSYDGPLWASCLRGVWRKIGKFWFLHFALLLVAAWYMPGRLKDFVRCALLVQSFCGKAKVALAFNWPTWFLSSLMFCYLMAPVLNRLASRFARHAVPALLSVWIVQVAWAAAWVGHPEPYGSGYYWVYICPFARMLDFFVGVWTAKAYAQLAERPLPACGAAAAEVAAVTGFVSLLVWHGRLSLPMSFQYCVVWMPVAVALVWTFAACKGPFLKRLALPPLMWLGLRSFELYIIHRVVLKAFADAGAKRWPFWLLSFALTCLLAEIAARVTSRLRHA